MKEPVCLQCLALFELNPAGNKLHCSVHCSKRTANQRARGEGKPHTRTCLQCPTVFEVNPNGSKLHCSMPCYRITTNERARGIRRVPRKPAPIPSLHHPFRPI